MTREAAQVALPTFFETVLRITQRLLRGLAQQANFGKRGENFALAFGPNAHVRDEFGVWAGRELPKNRDLWMWVMLSEEGAPFAQRRIFLLQKTQQLHALELIET